MTYQIFDNVLPEEEFQNIKNFMLNPNFPKFWDELIQTSAYSTIKASASKSLAVNTVATEFIALISDAKNSHANVEKIQEVLLDIMSNISFTTKELEEIQTAFTDSGMYSIYTLNP